MNGTWKVTGYGAGPVLAVAVAAAVIEGTEWVLARIAWILGTGLLCAVLAALALAWLMRWARARDERDAVAWERRRVQLGAPPPAQLRTEPVTVLPRTAVTPVTAPAIEHHHYGPQVHVYGADGEETAARIIRTALAGPPGEAITEGNGNGTVQ